ncbi:lmo0937 family membrane protein [Candidatus Parcubacteria bacterium]|jgi:hypothetical protein|nr:MAG: lmo0937 family membrane protein [Candidatus Parcubacteria bacterium]
MLWTIIIVLAILWFLGFSFKFGGKLIHTLLIAALITLAIKIIF